MDAAPDQSRKIPTSWRRLGADTNPNPAEMPGCRMSSFFKDPLEDFLSESSPGPLQTLEIKVNTGPKNSLFLYINTVTRSGTHFPRPQNLCVSNGDI